MAHIEHKHYVLASTILLAGIGAPNTGASTKVIEGQHIDTTSTEDTYKEFAHASILLFIVALAVLVSRLTGKRHHKQ